MSHRDKTSEAIKPRAYPLNTGYAMLNISETHGTKLVGAGIIRTIRLGPSTRRITEDEIQRLLREGIDRTALIERRGRSVRKSMTSRLQKPAAQN